MKATDLVFRDRTHIEQSGKRVRGYLGGELVVDSTRAKLVWEHPSYPAYYFPTDDVRTELLVPSSTVTHSERRGDAVHFTVKAGGKESADGAWRYETSPMGELRDLVRFDWNALDTWFEEDEEVFTHPRDPYTRIDILPTSRHVRVEIDGVTFADSTHARILFETGLPPRWYVPKVDVRLDLLRPTDTATSCPYKGQAQYWSASVDGQIHQDVAWSYRTPLPESERIAGLICFYNERVDLYVEGERQDRPVTKFSN